MFFEDVSIALKVSYLPRRYNVYDPDLISFAHLLIHSITLYTCDQIRCTVRVNHCVITWQTFAS